MLKNWLSIKKLISTSERCLEHSFAGRNTQQLGINSFKWTNQTRLAQPQSNGIQIENKENIFE